MTSPPPREGPAPRAPGHPATRTAGRRPSLPNGRAVLGGLLVATAAIGTFAAWSGADDEPSTRYVVAAHDLPVGRVVTSDDVEVVAFEAPASVAEQAFASAELVVGQRTVAPLQGGELVQRSAVVVPEGDDGGRQVSFAIEAADALAGTLEEGEEVDLLATFGASASTSATEVVAEGAVVARLTEGEGSSSGELVVLVTLPASADLLAVTDAIRQGALTIVRPS